MNAMRRRYSLWDTRIGSQLGRFDSEEDVLTFVRTLLATRPRESLNNLSSNWRDADGNVGEAITGEGLLDLAERGAERREPVSARPGEFVPSQGNTGHSGTGMPMAAGGRMRLAQKADGAWRALTRNRGPRVVQTQNGTRRRKG